MNNYTIKKKRASLIGSDMNQARKTCLSFVLFLTLFVSTFMVQQVSAGQFEGKTEHRATLIDINGNEINQAHPRYAKIVQDEGVSVHPDDSLALVSLYHAMNGEQWRDNTGWLVEKVEFWPGVQTVTEIDPDVWRVTQVNTTRENMTVAGTIPPEIGNMEYLELFRVQNDLLTGSIPPEFGEISTLQNLFPQNNYLSGEVPWEELGKLENFRRFQPRFNFLSGEMPSWMGEDDEDGNPYFPVIERLFLASNQFSGQIPASLGNRQTLERFVIDNNRFTGPIPDWSHLENIAFYFIGNNDFDPGPIPEMIRNWDNIERIGLANTNRTGTIPEWFGELTSLERLMQGGIGGEDEIGGEIPSSMQFLPNLWDFSLSGGNFSGPIPDWIANMPSLEIVDFQDIDFEGQLPASFGNVADMRRIFISGTQIEGGIPESWQSLSRMEVIELSNNPNMEIGDIPNWMAQNWTELEEVNLSGVGVTGEIPSAFEDLGGLERLILNDNPELGGELPSWLVDKDLRALAVSNSGFNIDAIPSWIENATRLDNLQLGGYEIEGQIPGWLGNENLAPTLNKLALDNNNFTGGIPSELGNLFVLDSLNLADNQLSGEVPASLLDMGKANPVFSVLQAVVLSGNADLTGEMPLFPDATFMRVIEFENTGLCAAEDLLEARANEIEAEATGNHPNLYFSVKGPDECHPVNITEETDRPGTLSLHNNYPNPFNPVTTIPYNVPNDMHVRISIYNILGQRVATLVDEQKSRGRYDVNFDASQLSSGAYIYRLETSESTLNKQMLLIK